jgi:predicted GNAT family N-acyltransferase
MTAEKCVHIATTEAELTAIYRLRYEVYIEQQGKPLPTADHKLRILKDDLDDIATNFYASTYDGEPTACGRATIGVWPKFCEDAFRLRAFDGFERKDFYYISKVMLNPRFRVATAVQSIFVAMYRDGRQRKIPFGIANCNPRLVPIYERFGWRRFGSEFMDPFAGPQVPILIVAPDVIYLRKIKSVLVPIAEEFPDESQFFGWFEKNFPAYSSEGTAKNPGRELDASGAV